MSKKNTEGNNPKVARTKKGRIMLLSKLEVCQNKNSKIIKQQEATILAKIYETNFGVGVK